MSLHAEKQDTKPHSPNSKPEKGILKHPKRKNPLLQLINEIFVDSGALRTSSINFLLCYNIRAGIAVLLHIIKLLRTKPKQVFKISELVGEHAVKFRQDAVRMGLFMGGFTGIYKAMSALLLKLWGGNSKWWHSGLAGLSAGSSLLFMEKSWHRTLGLYMATRAVQCLYNFAKKEGYWHFWGSDWAHGDSLLFIWSSAQVMYAYVMRPETLPPSYYRFIVNQGPIDSSILQAVRDHNRGKPLDMPAVKEYVNRVGGSSAMKDCEPFFNDPNPIMIPSRILHPTTGSAFVGALNAFTGVSKRIFPVYLTLAYVPAVVLRFQSFVKNPFGIAFRSLMSAIRSTVFLSSFCGGYMAFVDMYRIIAGKFGWSDHKLLYWVAGVFSSFSILIERKSRRAELALYAFPRGADSLYMILNDHKLAFRVPHGELLLFSMAMGTIMCFFENDKSSINPFLSKILKRFLPSEETVKRTNPIKQKHSDETLKSSTSTLSLSGSTIAP